jgi:hypothetical protein
MATRGPRQNATSTTWCCTTSSCSTSWADQDVSLVGFSAG